MNSFTRIWKSPLSLETFTLEINEAMISAGGILQNVVYGKPQYIRYKISLNHDFNLMTVLVEDLQNNMRLGLRREDNNLWYDEKDRPIELLNGCQTIDISCTPFTFALPILATACHENEPLKIAFLDSTKFIVVQHRHLYTKLGINLYEYQNLSTNVINKMEFDDRGLIENFDCFKSIYANEN